MNRRTMIDDLNKSLMSTIANSELTDLAASGAEIAIDSLLEDDSLLEQIPIIKTLLGVSKAIVSVRDRLFLEKIVGFLSEVSKIPVEQRHAFLQNLSEAERDKVAQYMILYIERLDSLEKPEMLGKVFSAYLDERIDQRAMLYFCHYIDRVFILTWKDFYEVLKDYVECRDKGEFSRKLIALDDARDLETVGFYVQILTPEPKLHEDRKNYSLGKIHAHLELSDSGILFIQTVFGFWKDLTEPSHIYAIKRGLAVSIPVKNV